ncbi:MAG: DUF3078 domain-containing protein [Bacteroidaceae bacterium]|nr:DUF3078 domain-containing protein [Bacteroidaceae bacterium]
MKRLTILFYIFIYMLAGNARSADVVVRPPEGNEAKADTSLLLRHYLQAIDTLARERDSLNTSSASPTPNAYYYQILSQPTLYSSPLHQMMSQTDLNCKDLQMQRLFASRKMLSSLYTEAPQFVTQTENEIRGQAAIRSDVNDIVKTSDKLADKVAAATLAPKIDEPVEVITRRPNFWKFSGNTSLQFTQNYFSDNWYKGGETNFTGNFTVTLRANYNDQRKISWENTLDAQLGFQTTDTDNKRTFRPSSNLLRYTTNAGYKAWKNLYYSLQVILQTQLAANYQKNSDKLSSKIFSPLEVTVAPGMKYEIAWGKKKRFTGTLNVAPLAMKIIYVGRDDIVKNYGIDEGKHQKTTFGPNITMNTRWQICKQISWTSRVYWMSNYHYNIWEWENTVDFSVTKLITAKIYLYPRVDDSNEKYRDMSKHHTYLMFKEWFSLGLSYSF